MQTQIVNQLISNRDSQDPVGDEVESGTATDDSSLVSLFDTNDGHAMEENKD